MCTVSICAITIHFHVELKKKTNKARSFHSKIFEERIPTSCTHAHLYFISVYRLSVSVCMVEYKGIILWSLLMCFGAYIRVVFNFIFFSLNWMELCLCFGLFSFLFHCCWLNCVFLNSLFDWPDVYINHRKGMHCHTILELKKWRFAIENKWKRILKHGTIYLNSEFKQSHWVNVCKAQ